MKFFAALAATFAIGAHAGAAEKNKWTPFPGMSSRPQANPAPEAVASASAQGRQPFPPIHTGSERKATMPKDYLGKKSVRPYAGRKLEDSRAFVCSDDDSRIALDSEGAVASCAEALELIGGGGDHCRNDDALVEMGAPHGWVAAVCGASCGTCMSDDLCEKTLSEEWGESGFACSVWGLGYGCDAVWGDYCGIDHPWGGNDITVAQGCPDVCGGDDEHTPVCVAECAMELFPDCEGDCSCGGTRECTCEDIRDRLGGCFEGNCNDGDLWWFAAHFEPYEACLCDGDMEACAALNDGEDDDHGDPSKCRDIEHDCCANEASGEAAECADGWVPSHQPQSFDDCPNYTCLPPPYPEGSCGYHAWGADTDGAKCGHLEAYREYDDALYTIADYADACCMHGHHDDEHTPACVMECAMELFPECYGDCTCGGTRECTCGDVRNRLGDCFDEKCLDSDHEQWFTDTLYPLQVCLCEHDGGHACFGNDDSYNGEKCNGDNDCPDGYYCDKSGGDIKHRKLFGQLAVSGFCVRE